MLLSQREAELDGLLACFSKSSFAVPTGGSPPMPSICEIGLLYPVHHLLVYSYSNALISINLH